MLIELESLKSGYNEITNQKTIAKNMLMDIGVQILNAGEKYIKLDYKNETAILLLSGRVNFCWENHSEVAQRHSLFDENPMVLHFPRGIEVTVEAQEDAELLIQQTENDQFFQPVFYDKDACNTEIFGENVWNDTARRAVRTVFDYNNAPYSNMVMGEVINYPGRWSSYIPHGHDQPEVYYYRFQYPQGFGVGFIGDDAYKIVDHSALCIPGGLTHPQAAAPGYAMWYCWMIRHLKDNPWRTRTNDPEHLWLENTDAKIWPAT